MYMNTTYSTKQSAVAMRNRMSDDTNKYTFNRKRILDRIREGSIPQQNTTKKYDMSNAEVNAIRKEGNHPPLGSRVRAVRVRTNISHQRRNQTHTSTLSRATTAHQKRQGRRTETRPIVQKTHGRTAWKNTQSSAGATVCSKDVPRLRVQTVVKKTHTLFLVFFKLRNTTQSTLKVFGFCNFFILRHDLRIS